MATIHKKVWPEYFELILAGKKKVEKTKNLAFWSPEEIAKHGFQIIQFEKK